MRVAQNSILANVFLAAIKLLAGLFAHSAALLSDAAHSFADIVSNVILLVGINLAGKGSDKEHPYGHERFECVAAIILACILFVTGAGIGIYGVEKLITGGQGAVEMPGIYALAAAVICILMKEGMFWYVRKAAKRISSGALMAEAWHHRSDALSSIGSFIGIMGARLGVPALDHLAAAVISIFILKAALNIFADSVSKITDRACDDKVVEEMRAIILAHRDVVGLDQLKTRLFGERVYVDIEIMADANATLKEANNIAQSVHDAIETRFCKVKHCMVRVKPAVSERGVSA